MTGSTALDILMEKMLLLLNHNRYMFEQLYEAKQEFEQLYEDLQFLRKFLKDSEEKRYGHEQLNAIATNIRDLTYLVEELIDNLPFLHIPRRNHLLWRTQEYTRLTNEEVRLRMRGHLFHLITNQIFHRSVTSQLESLMWSSRYVLVNLFLMLLSYLVIGSNSQVLSAIWLRVFLPYLVVKPARSYLGAVTGEISLIKKDVVKIFEKKLYGIGNGIKNSHQASSRPISTTPALEEETIVGLEDEANTIMELLLTQEHEKQLKVVSILGMPGLGKTTLARKVYDHPLIQYYFHHRAWTNVSPVYQRRDLLLSIFHSAFQFRYENFQMSDEELGEQLYKRLKGRRYLIVLDDIWTVRAWNDLKRYFSNDMNGSRILCTSRHEGVFLGLHAKFLRLRFLDENESWDLLQRKTFREDSCPPELMEIGKKIARKCQGLPLAIVVISGLLAKRDKTPQWWEHVAKSVSSYIVSDQEKYMDTLALSYNYLPHYLKPCFLYFGAFPEDYEIPVWQLIWLWVAEGFIRKNDQKSLEEVAEDYLMDLIGRSLVLVSKKRSDGGIKVCRVHDLLRDLCLRKAQEENFLQQISRYEHTYPLKYKHRRMCIHDSFADYTPSKNYESYVRSFLSFGRSFYNLPGKDVSFFCQAFKLLRVLNLLSIKILLFPKKIEHLIYLRYLAVHVEHEHGHEHFQPSISKLEHLETLIVDGPKGSLLLNDVWKMVHLRHVHTRRLIKMDYPLNDGCPLVLHNLQTIGKLNILDNGDHDQCVLRRLPNLKKLKCQCYDFPRLEFLVHLETLNLVYDGYERFSHLGQLPTNLKSLTLSNFRLPWKAMSSLGSLPNLKVLKLSYKAFEGARWDTSDVDVEFRGLRFLKLQGLDIEQWNVSSNHFANLETLVLEDCERLEAIPSSVGDISTLEMIQVRWCSYSVNKSARQLQEQQHDMGNDGLKILIYSLDDN